MLGAAPCSCCSGWRYGRLLLCTGRPALFALGLGPLLPALAGLVPRWPARLSTASPGWSRRWPGRSRGSDGLLAGGGFVASAVRDLDGERSPAVAAERLWQPLADAPHAGVQALALVVAALCAPLVLRARPGGPRPVAAAIWMAALGTALVVPAPDPADALGAVIPAAMVVIAGALRPWRALRRRAP